MRPGQRLSAQDYHQRLEETAKAFSGRYGEVEYGSVESRSGETAKLVIVVLVPGWGLPRTATLSFVEKHAWRAGRWHRYAYAYDLHAEPRPGGRFAYHWHDGVPHRHCVDPARPRPDHHYEAAYFDDIDLGGRRALPRRGDGHRLSGAAPARSRAAGADRGMIPGPIDLAAMAHTRHHDDTLAI